MRAAIIASCGVTLAIGIAGPNAEGCGWSGYERSLRFSNGSGIEDRLPPLPRDYRTDYPEFEGEAFWGYYGPEVCGCEEDFLPEEVQARVAHYRDTFTDATKRIDSGDIGGARVELERLVRESAGFDRDAKLGDRLHAEMQLIRNRAIDLLDVVRESEHGVSNAAIQAYAAVRVLDLGEEGSVHPWLGLLENSADEPRFADNVAYLNGAYLYSQRRFEEAAAAFDELRERWPRSEKCEAATYMAGVSWLRQSEWVKQTAYYLREEKTLDEASTRLELVAKLGKGSVYAKDARGWIARVAVAKYDMPTALVVYYTALADREDRSVQLEAARSLNLVRRDSDYDDLLEVEKRIERSPDVALAYAYYEIYNHESFRDPDEFDDSDVLPLGRTDQLTRIVAFCSRMSSRWPAGAVGAGFALRVAGASLQLDRPQDAERFAERALEAGPTDKERVEAMYLLATAKHGLGDFDGARSVIGRLRAAKPDAEMDERAGRLLATVCEDDQDLAGALDEYRKLGYEADAAYLIDTLMSAGQLEAYVNARPQDQDIDWLRYAVGVRLLRAGLYERAERALALVRTTNSLADDLVLANGYYEDERTKNLKQSIGCDSRVRTPRQAWVARDMQTAKDLGALERFAQQSLDPERAAEARYQFAAYLFDHESLLFYNPSLWWGNRADLLNCLDGGSTFRLPGEEARLWAETNAHDALAQSVDRFLDVVEQFPDSKAAPEALYSAAVAHDRLANFNGYWRSQYAEGRHAGRRLVTYDDVRRAYPSFRFPRGTIGWEASTRTVNGGLAWDPMPPKPKPVPAWRHYAKRVPEVIAEFGGPVVTAVWGTVRTAANWAFDLLKRAAILLLQAILLVTILAAWIAAVRSSFRLALDATNGHKPARALLPASSAYRPREHSWLVWAAGRLSSLRREGPSGLSIAGPSSTINTTAGEPRLDDRLVLFIERARLFLSTTPEGLAFTLVVVTHVPILLFLAMAL